MMPADPKEGLRGKVGYAADRRKPSVVIVEHVTVDFPVMLRYLRTCGYGINAVSLYANLSRSAVRNYLAGSQPLHSHGERLIKFYCAVSGVGRESIPVTRDLPTVSGSHP